MCFPVEGHILSHIVFIFIITIIILNLYAQHGAQTPRSTVPILFQLSQSGALSHSKYMFVH